MRMKTEVFVSLIFSVVVFIYFVFEAIIDWNHQKVYLQSFIEKGWNRSFYFLLVLFLISIVIKAIWFEEQATTLIPLIVLAAMLVKKLNYDYQRKIRERIAPTFSLDRVFDLKNIQLHERDGERYAIGEVSFIGAPYECRLEITDGNYQEIFDVAQWRHPLKIKFENGVFYPFAANCVALAKNSTNQ